MNVSLPMPHAGQQIVLNGMKRFTWLRAGRRWRKTTLAMNVAVRAALQGQHVLWGAPTADQVRIGWNETRKAVGGVAAFYVGRMEVVFPTGGQIIYRSLDEPDNARGHTVDGFVIDEAAQVKERAYYEVLRPQVSDTEGWGFVIGTPKGRNYFWRESMAAKNKDDSISWQAPTLGVEIVDEELIRKPHPMENPFFLFSEAQELFATQSERIFRQEFLAEFTVDEGLVFRKVRKASTLAPSEPDPSRSYVMGVDWGKENDFTVISVMDIEARKQVAIDRFNQIDWNFQVSRLKTMYYKWKPVNTIVEANAMGPVVDALIKMGIHVQPFFMLQSTKNSLIEKLSLAIERGNLMLLKNETQIEELEAYELQRLPSGSFRYNAPKNMHDDCCISLALAWHGVDTSGPAIILI